jgi:Protein of unknown function (DUF4239)
LFAFSGETWLLQNVPAWVILALTVVVCVGISIGGLLLVRRSVELSTLEAHHEVAGFILAVVGVVYAVLLAFIVIVVWQQADAARTGADREATILLAVYRDANALAQPGQDVRPAIRDYASLVVDTEWAEMAEHHRESRTADQALNAIWTQLRAIEPRTHSDEAFYDDAVSSMQEVSELRRTRIADSGAELVGVLWAVLIIGGIISIAFTYFFGVHSLAAQILMVGSLAALVGLVLAVIVSLDLPFTGDVAVAPDAMRNAITEFGHIEQDGP